MKVPHLLSTQTPHPAKAVLPDYVTPMEMRINTDVALACAGMTRKEANLTVKALLEKYEDNLETAPSGKSYMECFDLATAKPTDEYLDFVAGIKQDLSKVSIPLK